MAATTDAWTFYWRQFQGPPGTCLPVDCGGVERLLQAHWLHVAQALPSNARVLDLACGSGAVGRFIKSVRQDCTLVGVDSAAVPALAQMEIHSGTSIEDMPFEDASFDAAVSQFGFEYADPSRAAKELSRVLRGGAGVDMIVHNARGPIVAHNIERDAALKAIAGPETSQPFLAGDAAALADRFGQLSGQYERQDVIAEFANGLRSALDIPQSQRAELWSGLVDKIASERSIIGALRQAAVDDIAAWSAAFEHDFTLQGAGNIADSNEGNYAWVFKAVRK